MMRPNLYQASRMLTTVGVTADINFNPTQITTRMRKSIQRQLESGNITGGWSSHAARLARVMCEQFNLTYIRGDYWGLHVQFTSEEAREEACALMRADFAAYLLTMDGNPNNSWVQRSKNTLQENLKILASGESVHLRFHGGKEYLQMMRDLFVNSRSPSDVFNAKQVSNMLNQDSPIRINQHNWKD
jgi:hypothetical protein